MAMNNAESIYPDEISDFGREVNHIINMNNNPDKESKNYGFSMAPHFGLRLSGDFIAGVAANSYADGMNDEDVELYLYKINKGGFVCQKISVMFDEELEEREEAEVTWKTVDNHDAIKKFFGQGWLAQELYLKADIDNAEEVVSGAGEDCGDQYRQITVRRDKKPSLRFFGMSLGSISFKHEYDYDYEETLELFIMPNGQYVCKSIEVGVHEGELDHYYAEACEDYEGIHNFFKHRAGNDEATEWIASLKNMHNSKLHIEALTNYNLVK